MTSSYYTTTGIVALLLSLAAWIGWGWVSALSVVLGGLMALVNARWMVSGIDLALARKTLGNRRLAAIGFVFRPILIFAILFAIIHIPFLSVLGVVWGLSAGVLSAIIEEFRQIVWKSR